MKKSIFITALCYMLFITTALAQDPTPDLWTGTASGGPIQVTGTSDMMGKVTIAVGGLDVVSGGVNVTSGGVSVTSGGVTVQAGGADVTGNSSIKGDLEVTKKLNVGDDITM